MAKVCSGVSSAAVDDAVSRDSADSEDTAYAADAGHAADAGDAGDDFQMALSYCVYRRLVILWRSGAGFYFLFIFLGMSRTTPSV